MALILSPKSPDLPSIFYVIYDVIHENCPLCNSVIPKLGVATSGRDMNRAKSHWILSYFDIFHAGWRSLGTTALIDKYVLRKPLIEYYLADSLELPKHEPQSLCNKHVLINYEDE